MSSDSSRAAKRPRQGLDNASGEDEPPIDLLALYKSDFGDKILSYASGADLCTLDILNKQFKRLTTDQWNTVTKERFGMSNGKEGWKVGTSFLRPPVFIHLTEDESRNYGFGLYRGCPRVAANESIIVAATDGADDIYHPNNEMGTRDASTLNYIRSIPSPIRNWRVSICGRVGSEIIVTSNHHQFCARRGNDLQRWSYNVNVGNGIPSIGCETHLIVAVKGVIKVYEVNLYGGRDAKLLLLRQTVTVDSTANRFDTPCIAWGPDKTHFIVFFPDNDTICLNSAYVYKFDKETNSATQVNTIGAGVLDVNNVALADDYVVASSSDMKIHVWNRNTGEEMVYTTPEAEQVYALCDVDLDEDEEEELLGAGYSELQLSCHGHILVSTSRIGCAICIWNLKTGQLLKRYNEANEEEVTESNDATDMTYLESLNAFLCMDGYMNIWSFPTNKRQYDMATSTRRREEMVSRAIHEE